MSKSILILLNNRIKILKIISFFTIIILFSFICYFIINNFNQNTKKKLYDLYLGNSLKIEESLFLGNMFAVNNKIQLMATYSDSYISKIDASIFSTQGELLAGKHPTNYLIPTLGFNYKILKGQITETNRLSFADTSQGYIVLTAHLNFINLILYSIFALVGCVLLYLLQNYLINSLTSFVKIQIINPIQLLLKHIKTKTDNNVYMNTKNEIKVLSQAIDSYINSISVIQAQLIDSSKMAAIGQISQMIAHDIRKPFSMLKITLDMFEHFTSNPSLLKRSKDNIDKAIASVEVMISDIINFSQNIELDTKPSNLVSTINLSIRQTTQNYQNSKIEFNYSLMHTKQPLIDEKRILRAFENIISNAIEAITQMGEVNTGIITISTKDVVKSDNNYIEITIGNNGPPFQSEDIPNLFKSFFTKGKKGGIGLGLASTNKIINLHKGKIEAQNRLKDNVIDGVEFIILLPSSNIEDQTNINILPKNIKDTELTELVRENKLLNETNTLQITEINKKVLLLDDEVIYRASIKNIIKKNEYLDKTLTIYDASNVEEALKLIETVPITHAIVDIDLNNKKDGFDFLEEVRKRHSHIDCMIHSNRFLNNNYNTLGVKMFAIKPITIDQLILFLSDQSST